MNLTDKQKILLDAAKEKGQLTKKEADKLLEKYYYYNHSKYVSEVLARMVSAGIMERIKVGVYRLKEASPYKDEDQLKLL
jgi:predicted transcriptional regulator of viral defense system